MAAALGVERLDDIGDRIAALLSPKLPVGLSGLREAFGKAAQLATIPPKKVRTAELAREARPVWQPAAVGRRPRRLHSGKIFDRRDSAGTVGEEGHLP